MELLKYPTVEWSRFMRSFRWEQGEHLLVCAQTGQGKTTLLSQLLPKRDYILVFVTKIKDDIFEKEFLRKGYSRVESWPPPTHLNKVLLWPRYPKTMTLKEIRVNQAIVFEKALNGAFHQTGWTMVFDEEHYLTEFLKLRDLVAMYHHQARSSKLTVVDGIQRPSGVPVITYGSASHAFVGKFTEAQDLLRLSSLAGLERKTLSANMLALGDKEWIYVDARRVNSVPIHTKVRL